LRELEEKQYEKIGMKKMEKITNQKCYYQIYITSKYTNLHGIKLRENIRKLLYEKMNKISLNKAWIMNIFDNESGVKILCVFDEYIPKNKVEEIFQNIINNVEFISKKELSEIKIIPEKVDKNKDYEFSEGIRIKRENELLEMTWALQGAGEVFIRSMTIQQKIFEQNNKNEILSTLILLETCKNELKVVSNLIHNDKKINIFSLESLVSDPPLEIYKTIKKSEFKKLLTQVLLFITDINIFNEKIEALTNHIKFKSFSSGKIDKLKPLESLIGYDEKELKELKTTIHESIEKLRKELGIIINKIKNKEKQKGIKI